MDPTLAACLDELRKIAASGKIPFSRALTRQLQARVGKSLRAGTRPQRATTLLARHKDGTHKAKLGEYTPTLGNAMTADMNAIKELVAKKPRKPGDVPSREDMDGGAKRYDQRDNAATVQGPGAQLTQIGATNFPTEHGTG